MFWHTEAHCWDNVPVGAATRQRYQPPPLRQGPADTAATELPPAEIAFPQLRVVAEMPNTRWGWDYVPWLSPWPMTGWPLVYDYDEPSFIPWRKRVE